MTMSGCKLGLALLLLSPSAGILLSSLDFPQLGRHLGDGIYFVTARSLATGKGYRIESHPQALPQTKFPPLYPLFLAFAWMVVPSFPSSGTVALILQWLGLPVFLHGCALFFRNLGFRERIVYVLCLITVSYPAVLETSFNLLSDLWFASFVMYAFALLGRHTRPAAVALGAVVAGACLTRVVGVTLLFAAFLYLLRSAPRRLTLIFSAVAMPPPLVWFVWSHFSAPAARDSTDAFYTSYVAHLPDDLILHIITSGKVLVIGLGAIVVPKNCVVVPDVIRIMVGLLAIAGLIPLARKVPAAVLFTGFYCAALLAWQWSFDRFFLPLVPAVLASLGLVAAGVRVTRIESRLVLGLVATVFVVVYGIRCYEQINIIRYHRTLRTEFQGAYRWISRNTGGASKFVAFRDPLVYLYTGRRAEFFYGSCSAEGVPLLAEFARRRGHEYILLGRDDFTFQGRGVDDKVIRRDLEKDPGVRTVYNNGHVRVYAVLPDKE